ncbi:hypothetical protein F4778DRAFT_751699 [Xylariomycetidae sp. FL2044]|nr:hypothetical protein F4778DRAFT_751699 [Xylariomycetidae sp. FL2044]
MDSNEDFSQLTQQATQNALDPRRIGKQNSGFSDEDISDIICILYPKSESACLEVRTLASSPEHAHHTTGMSNADAIRSDLYLEDDAREFGRIRGLGDHAILLKLSSPVKDAHLGFTFGRNQGRCDVCFAQDPNRRLSNIHFRIFVNPHGSVMLEDSSTNGTVVDNVLLRKKGDHSRQPHHTRRTLESGSTVKIVMHDPTRDLEFLVRIPRREGELEVAYTRNVQEYLERMRGQEDLDRTIGPGPTGHVNLFPPRRGKGNPVDKSPGVAQGKLSLPQRLPREWRGGEKYAVVGRIGKGAFAVVHKVTSKYDGLPYAAKELDKRKFIKNGIVDQKVENEMRIMQRIQHTNIVQYIEHFDWDAHQFIIIMEYVPGGDLGKYVQEYGSIAEPHVKVMADQLIDALGYLHDNRITHRDVKPDNILIQSTYPLVVKLTDFGLSKMIDTEQTFLKTFCGTLLYCAPEVYTEYSSYDDTGRRTNRKPPKAVGRERYDHAVDIWSLGGVLFYTLTGSPPFPVRNGTTYMELLDHIIKTPLDTSPLSESKVAERGIHFLSRMIHVRPESRATIAELQSHPWLKDESFDDQKLSQETSLLKLNDTEAPDFVDIQASSLREPEPDYSMEFESEKENFTFGRPQPNRLFGEVNNSAIGSSGAIPEERLNVPVSGTSLQSLKDTESFEPEILDSFDNSDDLSTPRQGLPLKFRSRSKDEQAHSDAGESVLLGNPSQSLGGASAILENLNMKSLATRGATRQLTDNDLSTSKRKPAYDTSDEYDIASAYFKPSFKRLKSQGDAGAPIEDGNEFLLFASVPQAAKNDTGRQIDYPLPKTTFWDGSDKNTWHLNYPEMTHLQYDAFQNAARLRNEEFGPGKTRLWNLAMENFPPINRSSNWELPSTAQIAMEDGTESLPDTAPPDLPLPSVFQSTRLPKTVIGEFRSAPGSVIEDISILLQEPVISWGRERTNTVVYEHSMESRVPKNAFRILLWREGYHASFDDFRPWEPPRSTSSRTVRASPEPDSYAFFISTKATNGIRINSQLLRSNEPKDSSAACRHWMKLHHDDTIAFWGPDGRQQAKVTFACHWGGSSAPRPAGDKPTCIPESQARKLDRLWPKAVNTLLHDRIKTEAQVDQEMRMQNMSTEQERSRVFEEKRAEAVRIMTLRASRQTSPASAPPVAGRTIPQFRQTSPLF